MRSFVREKTVHAGDYKELSIFVRTSEQEKANRRSRKRRKKISRPAQRNLNDKNSKRYAMLLLYSNFTLKDYYLTITYYNKYLPETPDDAKKTIDNYLSKLRRLYKKHNQDLKYMWFTEFQYDDDTGYIKRIHHHVVVNKGPSRDEVEDCWSVGRGKNKEKLGRTEARIIQKTESGGIHDLAMYLTTQGKHINGRWKKGQKRWSSSKNLTKPYETKNDHKYSLRKLEKIAASTDAGEELFKQLYPDYQIVGEVKIKHIEDSGWHIRVELLKYDSIRPG
ncbi:rolling circle replication-associated protein [Enterococcus sp. AZ007]|uniref:rolling circle replication-associated protein n=1 Tax=Enterococcus sp. AZ007 TaxID=2774839 RepID=UPI003F28C68A